MDKGFFSFGTMNAIHIESDIPEEQQQKILDEMQNVCRQLDDRFSAFKKDSDIGRINHNAGKKAVPVSKMTFRLLKRAKEFSALSEGAFDVTIRPAVNMWNTGRDRNAVPSEQDCRKIRKLVDYRQLILDDKEYTAFLEQKGQSLDLGGIAKGYAGDLIRDLLQERNVTDALINFGGTILTLGQKRDKTPWRAGIQNPLQQSGKIVGSFNLGEDVLVTSGVNERFFIKDGIRYHHLLDPATCRPASSGVLSVTAAGGSGMDLDGLTTAFFVLGTEKGIPLAVRLGVEVLYLMESGEIIATKEFADGKYRFLFEENKS